MTSQSKALATNFADAYLLAGVRTPFADYNGALAQVSPTDLSIMAACAVLARADVEAVDVGTVIAGNVAQASFDAFMPPRHIGPYAGGPIEVPAHLVQQVCGTGIEVVWQPADAVSFGRTELALCVGCESMRRNPIAAYMHRGGFRLGQVEFKDLLWEALLDPAANVTMGDTAENLARKYQSTAARSIPSRKKTDSSPARSRPLARRLSSAPDTRRGASD